MSALSSWVASGGLLTTFLMIVTTAITVYVVASVSPEGK